MKISKLRVLVVLATLSGLSVLATRCSSSSSASSSTCSSDSACCTYPSSLDTSVTSLPAQSTDANMNVTLGCGYINEPCVTVTICEPGSTSRCRTIPNVLLDTGSYGLRLFNCTISGLNLPTENYNGGEVAECVSYADGSQDWGPVKMADIYMGNQMASNTGIQYIDANYATAPDSCSSRENNPALIGFNGILGVGLFRQDCGATCVTTPDNNLYYTCSGGNCTASSMPLTSQVQNPVSLFPANYNNGVSLDFTSFPAGTTSAVSASGTLTIGIPNSVSATGYSADAYGNFRTYFNGAVYGSSPTDQAFIDSGSNGLFFPSPAGLTACPLSGSAAGFYCPTGEMDYTAHVAGSTGNPSANSGTAVPFSINNASTMLDSSNPDFVFTQIGGNMSGAFDWGLPFFLSKKVYVQMENVNANTPNTTSLGTGAAWGW